MSNSAVEITNLLYRYAELIDGGDLEGAAGLFRHARIKTMTEITDDKGLLDIWKRYVRIYPCGTPRTKHVVTNSILEIDEAAGTAKARSYYSVLQAVEGLPLQVIAAGRYHDEFRRIEGAWCFSYRDYSLLDLVGDMRAHMKEPLR